MPRAALIRWIVTFVGVALIAALLWYFGPLLPPLDSPVARLVIVAIMVAVWSGANLLIDRRRRKRDVALAQGVAAADATAAAASEEVAALTERLATAVGLLKRARGSRGYLYEQPWYVIIGPPGAGKTTALMNAGLRFPLAAEMGQGAVAGVGGTRLCDWWFTDEAVLIDTAGRYTTQDSQAAVDRAGWEGFLGLLKRTRPRQPLNGVLVAIALSDIAQASKEERLAHARAIRSRVKELQERLSVRLPVYALFTKADLLSGFSEFFDDLDSEKRAQVWGTTFPLAQKEAGPVSGFAAEFGALMERLNARLIDRLQAERSPDRRVLLAGFPAQFASLELPLQEFLQEAFGGSRLDPAPLLRGVYFTSGTQEGTPIDRLTGALARAFGVDQRRLPSLRPQEGRSYFLSRLLKSVIFGEAMLVVERPGTARRRLLVRGAAYAAAVLVLLLGAGLLWQSRAASQKTLEADAAALSAYEATAKGLSLDPVNDDDLPKVLPLLDQARNLPHGGHAQVADADPSAWWRLGLSQEAKLAAGERAVYRHALERVLLPRLIWRLEQQMRANLERADFLYQATRIYLMLGSTGPLDRGLVREWMNLDWQSAYPGPVNAPVRDALALHLDALLGEPLPEIALDGALVDAARATFSRVPLAARVYSRIQPSAAAQALPMWKPADALGPAGVNLFVRVSGKPLTEGIPGFFTVEGFHKVLLPALGNVTKDVAAESWVLGQKVQLDPNSPQLQALEQDVIKLYTDDYAKQWDAMLADLNIEALRSLQQAAQDLYVLSSPQSPLRDLLAAIARQLTLSVPPPEPQGAAATAQQAAAGAAATAQQATGAVQQPASSATAALQGAFAATQSGPPPPPPGKAIDDRYQALRDAVGTGPGAPIDSALKAMSDLQQQLAKLAATTPGQAAAPMPTGDDPMVALKAEAQRQPQPLSRWLTQLVGDSNSLRSGGARQNAAAAYNASGGPASLCRAAVKGRYPFTMGSGNDIPTDDFARLFAPNGLIDGYFNTQLRPYVDVSRTPWAARAVDGVPAPVSAGDLAQFQRAAAIRDLFFGAGGTTPTVRFDITPATLDPGAKQVTLDLGGPTVDYAHGPPRPTSVTWPGQPPMTTARLVFDPPPAGGTGVLQASGPWALFRLFDQGRLQQTAADRYTLTFRLGERQASFEIRAGSVLNPFMPGTLHEFRCPSVQ